MHSAHDLLYSKVNLENFRIYKTVSCFCGEGIY